MKITAIILSFIGLVSARRSLKTRRRCNVRGFPNEFAAIKKCCGSDIACISEAHAFHEDVFEKFNKQNNG
tara:strand:+ start:171 stop:380 length:210 start_codon:yes stop_codon:yes gene_type:complete